MLRAKALTALSTSSIAEKIAQLDEMCALAARHQTVITTSSTSPTTSTCDRVQHDYQCQLNQRKHLIDGQWQGDSSMYILPGAPNSPQLVNSKYVKKRGFAKEQDRAILLHALAHIEFNAINLALDIIWRFANCPEKFYLDWLQVAKEEAEHFTLLNNRLQQYSFQYGDFPAHAGLWEMAEKTQDNLLARLTLVPCTLEARGLDVTPSLIDKIKQCQDFAFANILEKILADEIGHVAIGLKWLRYFAKLQDITIEQCFVKFQTQYSAAKNRPPYNFTARLAAGFDPNELSALCSITK